MYGTVDSFDVTKSNILHQLSICGVRSFDSRESEVIEFGKPLTLIVGPNGTGKTVSLFWISIDTRSCFLLANKSHHEDHH